MSRQATPLELLRLVRRYIYDVSLKSTNKKLYWNDEIINPDTQAVKLRELNTTIRTIIQSKPEYAKLPQARGGYM